MKKVIISFFLMLFFISSVFSNNINEGTEIMVFELAKSMPSTSIDQIKTGKFFVKNFDRYFGITYMVGKTKVFDRKLYYSGVEKSSGYNYGFLDVIPIVEGGYSCLLIKAQNPFNAPPNSYILYPNIRSGSFLIKPIGWAEYKNVDGKKDKKRFVIMENAYMAGVCGFSNADSGRDLKAVIYSFSPETGELINVSANYPKYYKKLANDYRIFFEEFKKYRDISSAPECEKYIKNRIADYENIASGRASGSKSTPTPPPPLSFANRCGVCHGVDRALNRKETRERWANIIDSMMRKKAGWISLQEANEILDWLSKYQGE